jgi:ribonuclease VapC
VIVDTSALVGIAVEEPGYEPVLQRLASATSAVIGAPTLFETSMVLAGKLGVRWSSVLDRFVADSGLTIVPFTERHLPVAVDAFLRYGKGRHPARLNFGDCLTYALAKVAGEPLLCLGNDFAQTDLQLA